MRRLLLVTLALLGLAAGPAAAGPVFFVTGHGWGHGIGMSQYGAQGFAQHGWTHDQILTHYYSGTSVLPLGSSPRVAVLLASGRSSLTIGSSATFTVTGAGGSTWRLAAGRHVIRPDLRVVDTSGRAHVLRSPVRFDPGSQPLRLGTSGYRGYFGVASTGSSLSAVDHVGLELYLRGVVPREMPASWDAEALEAQAVAARSYAYVSSRSKPYLYPDTRDQVYGGIPAETAATTAAVRATAHQVVKYNGSVVQAFFSSTSGGRTCAISDCWGVSPVPYFSSVSDPYDTISPYHTWGPYRYTQRQMRDHLGSLDPIGLHDVELTTNGSLRASSVSLVGASTTRAISPTTFQIDFGLRSTWFRVGVLGLSPADRSIVYGHSVTLNGFAKGLGSSVAVDQKPFGGSWQRVGSVAVSAKSFTAVARPKIGTLYRAVSRYGLSLATSVAVAPRVTIGHPASNRLAGQEFPARTGVTISVQKRLSGSWKTVATAVTDATGAWSKTMTVGAGRYRATVNLGAGFLPGASIVLIVS